MIARDGAHVAAFGAVSGPFTPSVLIENDPRVYEEELYYIKRLLERPDTRLMWIDATAPGAEDASRASTTPGVEALIVAIAGGTREQRRQVNNRIATDGRTLGALATWYVDIDDRFATETEWRDYLRTLPSSRPADVFVRFTLNGVATELREGEYAVRPTWQLYVHKVLRMGTPGEWSHVGIVHESLGLERSAVIETVEAIASRDLHLSVV